MNTMKSSQPTLKDLYETMRTYALKDPIIQALFRHEIDWADVEDHADYKAEASDLLLNEQMDILEAIKKEMKLTELYQDSDEKKERTKVRFADPNEHLEPSAFEQFKAAMFPNPSPQTQQVQQIPPEILFNPRQIKTVIARNLPRDITNNELSIIFEQYGPIRDIYIPRNTDRSSPYFGSIKGFALIKYLSSTDSTRAVMSETNRLHIRGKQISIEYAKEDR